ncbi:hypothetical protein [Nocardioides halotolerans]|jgi:hypothetical protein|uniref:hypothetical protein n=1 Tax=Nocardioides halotolerans TaxID=433660 RepID=UPI00041369F2|nr:hypothetical protein [Nocardioides halotolerans]
MMRSLTHLLRTQLLGLLALLVVLTGGTALAATSGKTLAKTVAKNTVVSKSIKNGQVRAADLAAGAVGTDQVAVNALTGADIDESKLDTVPDAASLGGTPASSYLRGTVVQKESAVAPGTDLGDGTAAQIISCDPGDILLTGGPANLSATSDMVESFPTAGPPNSLKVRVNKHGVADNFSVVILCLDRP